MEELSDVCSQIVLKRLYLARIGRPDIPWSVNTLARAHTKWTRACDKRPARLISYIHGTSEYKQHFNVGKNSTTMSIGTVSRLRLCRRSWSHTVQRNLRLFLLMQVCEWTEVPRLISGFWSLMCYKQVQLGNRNSSKHGAARLSVKNQKRERTHCVARKFFRDILNCRTLILFPLTWKFQIYFRG